MRHSQTIFTLILGVILLSFPQASVHAQDANINNGGYELPPLERIDDLKQEIIEDNSPLSHVFLHLKGYIAANVDDVSICDGGFECEQMYWLLTKYKLLIGGNCQKLVEFSRDKMGQPQSMIDDQVDFCSNLPNCELMTNPYMKQMCEAGIEYNPNKLASAFNEWGEQYGNFTGITVRTADLMISYLYGFRDGYNRQSCEDASTIKDERAAYRCELIFSPYSSDQLIDYVASDLAFLQLVIDTGDTEMCNYIKNEATKQGCLSEQPDTYFDPDPNAIYDVQPDNTIDNLMNEKLNQGGTV